MSHSQSQLARAQSETQLLQFLSDANASPFERSGLTQTLTNYPWSAPDHTILFECICELLSLVPQQILAHLPAALTRRGFPDISCDFLHEPCELDGDSALALAEKLLRASQ